MTNDELFWELSERLRTIESRLFDASKDNPMLIQELRVRAGSFFDRAYANVPSSLGRIAIQRLRSLVIANLDTIKTQTEQLFDGGDFAAGVDFVIAYARGNLGKIVPWYLRPFVSESKILDQLGTWLKANAGLFRDGIGALPPTPKTEAQ